MRRNFNPSRHRCSNQGAHRLIDGEVYIRESDERYSSIRLSEKGLA